MKKRFPFKFILFCTIALGAIYLWVGPVPQFMFAIFIYAVTILGAVHWFIAREIIRDCAEYGGYKVDE